MPSILGPLACFNLSCLVLVFLVLWHTANSNHAHTPARYPITGSIISGNTEEPLTFASRAERFLEVFVDVFGLDPERQWEDLNPDAADSGTGGEEELLRPSPFGGEASLWGAPFLQRSMLKI